MGHWIFNYAWLLLILSTFLNAYIIKARSRKYIGTKPELKKGYDLFITGMMIYGNIPWLIMMLGSISGVTENIFMYFLPRTFNPIVLIFHCSIVLLWLLGIRWIYFKGGASFLEEHPGLLNTSTTALKVKLIFPLLVLGGVVAMVLMWQIDPSEFLM